jgi:hypothetical protein
VVKVLVIEFLKVARVSSRDEQLTSRQAEVPLTAGLRASQPAKNTRAVDAQRSTSRRRICNPNTPLHEDARDDGPLYRIVVEPTWFEQRGWIENSRVGHYSDSAPLGLGLPSTLAEKDLQQLPATGMSGAICPLLQQHTVVAQRHEDARHEAARVSFPRLPRMGRSAQRP